MVLIKGGFVCDSFCDWINLDQVHSFGVSARYPVDQPPVYNIIARTIGGEIEISCGYKSEEEALDDLESALEGRKI